MRRFILPVCLSATALAFSVTDAQSAGLGESRSRFYFSDGGTVKSARIIRWSRRVPIIRPSAPLDESIDPKLRRAASIAEERAHARTKARCWQYVKEALVAAGAVSSYPKTAYGYQAGEELTRVYGFKKLSIRDPYKAPLGSVLVYGGRGHVEIRTKHGFASDYKSNNSCFFPLIGVYAKNS